MDNTKVIQYSVARYPDKTFSFLGKILVFLGFWSYPKTFSIWINEDYKKGDVVTVTTGEQYIIIKKCK